MSAPGLGPAPAALPMPGFSVNQLAAAGPISRNKIYDAIADGSLVARKLGKRTIILPTDWEDFLKSLPKVGPKMPLREPEALRRAPKHRGSQKFESP